MIRRRKLKGDPAFGSETDRVLRRSTVYREFQKERQEIRKLKWIESEKSGKDIGYEQALFLWARAHKNSWRAARFRNRLKKHK